MSSKHSVKEFYFISYLLIILAIVVLPLPSANSSLSGRTTPTIPITHPALLFFAFQLVYNLRRRVIYTGRREIGRTV